MTVLAVLAMVLPTPFASAQEVNTNAGGTGKITVRNASQSQKYTIYKLFDATVTEDGSGISYKVPTGKILPADNPYFAVDTKVILLQRKVLLSLQKHLRLGQRISVQKLQVLQRVITLLCLHI